MRRTLTPLVIAPLAIVLAIAAPAIVAPARANAQEGNIRFTIEEFGGRSTPVNLGGTADSRPISAAECEANAPIPIDIANAPYDVTRTQVISVWRGATSAACQTGTNRRNTGTGEPPCTFVRSYELTGAMQDIEIGAGEIFESCDVATSIQLWFLIVDSAMDTTADVTNYFSFRVDIDPVPPEPATGLSSSAGDTQISLSWTNPGGTAELDGGWVYYDPSGCTADGMVGTTTLVAGEAPPAGASRIEISGVSTSTTLSGEALGLEYGEYAAVGVTLVDRAQNESVLSEIVCVQRVQVEGFWDAYCAERGMDVETCRDTYGCGVASSGAGRSENAVLWMAMLAMIGVAARRGRRAR